MTCKLSPQEVLHVEQKIASEVASLYADSVFFGFSGVVINTEYREAQPTESANANSEA